MSIRRAGMYSRRGANLGRVSGAFTGNFATLFPGAFQVVQTDRGLTYGATPLATAGNTSTTVLTLSGTITGPYVPILVKAANSSTIGALSSFSISFDGGSTFPMVAVSPSVGVPVALTGAGAGLFIAWAAGTSVTNDTWNATAAGLADQSGNGKDYSQASAALQPVVTIGLNGKPGLLFDGVNDLLDCATLNMPAPAVTPWSAFAVFRLVSFTGFTNPRILSGISSSLMILYGNNGAPGSNIFGNGVGPTSTKPTSNVVWYATGLSFTNSTADYLRVGNQSAQTGINSLSAAPTGRRIGGGGATFTNVELLMLAYVLPQPETAWRTAINSAAGYGLGNVEV